ncbi:MAG: N-acetylmuramoyl-L-alanine amidase family protein [Defluviitaleaceae bacterium]|nr:N-acetylmuramoyl-L-alanine amidase family protein [Defluviitaleaceae bacterium]
MKNKREERGRRIFNGGLRAQRMAKIFAIAAVLAAVLFLPVAALGYEDVAVRLVIDGGEVEDLTAPPIIVNDRTLVPVREVFERVGGVVGWHEEHRQVSLFYGDDVLVMTIDETDVNLNGYVVEMQTPPIIHNERTMVPLRFPAEMFGFYVNWDDEERAAVVSSPGNGNGVENNGGNGGLIFLGYYDDSANDSAMFLLSHEHEPENEPESDGKFAEDELPPPGVTAANPQTPANSALARDVSTIPIQTIAHEPTTLIALHSPRETGAAAFVAFSSSPISEVQYFLLPDNRLVVDIHNATSAFSGDFDVTGLGVPVGGVRAAQFSQIPAVARIVFDVIGAAEYSISLSADRTQLTISFARNRISAVSAGSDAFSDVLHIQGDVQPSITVSTEGFPHFITLNIENADMAAPGGIFAPGVFASHFDTGQNADGSAFVRIFVREAWPSFSISQGANSAEFMMHHAISGLRYDSVNRELRISRHLAAFDIQNATRINDYLRFNYTFVLPATAEILGRGEMSVPDGFVNSVSLARVGENVHLTFNTARVLSFTVFAETDYYVIRAHLPREVSPFIVVIDPGHGGPQPGASHNGIVEKDFALTVSQMVMQLLDADPFITAFATRHADTYVSLLGRAEFANNIGAGLFVSLHANAASRNRVVNPDVQGIETWYTIGELEYAANNRTNSRSIAQIFQRNLIIATHANDRGLRNGELVVLRETEMPSVLLELGFLTSPDEAARLASPIYQAMLAQAIYQSIVEAFALA